MQGFSLLQLGPSLDIAYQRLLGGLTAGLNVSVAIRVAIINNVALTYRMYGVFWINIAKSEVNLRYRNCSNLFGILRREIEFRYYRCRNSTKSMREKKKKVERENVEFRQRGYRISCAQFCCLGVSAWSARSEKKKKIWQTNCGNAIAEIGKKIVTIVADCYCWMKKIISVLNSNLN